MTESFSKEYLLGSPLEHNKTCETHELPIDIICEDCDKFICNKCTKTDHRDHEWKTLSTAATEKRRSLLKYLTKIKEEDLTGIDEKMEQISQQITENKELCDSEIKRLHKHCETLLARLVEILQRHERTLKDNLLKKNDQLNQEKSELDKKKRGIVNTVEFMEENNCKMSNYSLIDNHRELTKMLSELEVHSTNCEHSLRFIKGKINVNHRELTKMLSELEVHSTNFEHSLRFIKGEIYVNLIEYFVGKTLDLDNIGVTQINSFQYGAKTILSLETFSEDQCYIHEVGSKYIDKVNQQGIGEQFNISPNDMSVTDNGYVYFTEFINNSIRYLSPSRSVSIVICTYPLVPIGICQSVDDGILVTLIDRESDDYKLDSHSRRLVRRIRMTGDVHEYEYQEDGQTRLFTYPYRVTQNINRDICVVNRTSDSSGELVIMSPSGYMNFVYRGQSLTKNFDPIDVVSDSFCNILVIDFNNKQIHLLSPDGDFLKFLLTDNEVYCPYRLSLYKSTLWVGYREGIVKVFQYTV